MAVRPPSLRSIAAFEAAARHASFTRAADELNLTPGAISHAIKALEQRLDQQLFTREGRAVALTAAGRTLAARVRLSLGLLADAFDTAPWRARDRLVISTLASIAERLFLPVLSRLQAAAPGMMLDLRCTTALADLDRDIDLAIRFGPGGWRGVQTRFLGDEMLFPVVSRTYNRGEWPRDQTELADHVLIHHPESSWRLWLDPAAPDPSRSGNALYIDDSALAVEAAAAGHGIALARGRLVVDDLRSGRLVRLFEREVPAEYSYWAVWNPSSTKLPVVLPFVEAVAALFTDEIHSIES
ncbi:LysR substrate-binding domain-containing protein [Sphingomonas sp. URHD0057]|uniref:LysR substrate-binding domain-containing protein n=1 Tax=Sphingomonas sp. URHD0057 TaxID=1380389 RepID=UPI00068595B3|nr:LysR substrate-binding domain-containing protein [Sphingomonas sp. URHD0057]